LPSWYGAADLFCLATHREGSPNVVFEALACGTPVVATDVGAIAQVVSPGENGYLAPPNDVAALAERIEQALGTRWDRGRIATEMDKWAWSRCGAQVREVYEALAGAPAG
jgi:teichuronic acid biosynthesis glycosyltransferase TuaC